MPAVNKRIQLQCVLDNLDDAQVEIVQLKMVIGLIIAKLPPEQREDLIQELRNFGLSSSAQEFTQFVVEYVSLCTHHLLECGSIESKKPAVKRVKSSYAIQQ